jgi:hypothetical protein
MAVAAAANALCSVADVKYVWGRAQADLGHDDRIQTLINLLSGRIEDWCGRKFKEATYTAEAYDGDGEMILPLKQYPITELTDVTIDGVEVDTDDVNAFKLYADEGFLWYAPCWSAAYPLGIKVTYKAGYATIPPGLSMACVEWVILLLEGRMKDAKVKGEDLRTAMPDAIESALRPYKRMDG